MFTPTRTLRALSNVSLPRTLRDKHWVATFCAAFIAACGTAAQNDENFDEARDSLTESLTKPLFGRTPIDSSAVLDAVRSVPRHEFVPESVRDQSYVDAPLPIGHDQTISQPYIVAFMTQLLDLQPSDAVLEIGTGSGYQAAILSGLVERVYTIEIVPELGEQARADLRRLGYENVEVRIGDGYKGWPEHAPFDGVIVTAAPDHIPQPLVDQLKPGGRMVIPVGAEFDTQDLLLISKSETGEITQQVVELVRFVPMTGEAQDHPDD